MLANSAQALNSETLGPSLLTGAAARLNLGKDVLEKKQTDAIAKALIKNLSTELLKDSPTDEPVIQLCQLFKYIYDADIFLNVKEKSESVLQIWLMLSNELSTLTEHDYKKIINNITLLLDKNIKTNYEDDNETEELINLLIWVQDLFFFANVRYQLPYKNILDNIKEFKTSSTLTTYDKFFRFGLAINGGSGIAVISYFAAPLLILSFIGFLGLTVPPIGLTLITIGCALFSVAIGVYIFVDIVREFNKKDNYLNKKICNREYEINVLIAKSARLDKEIACAQRKQSKLLATLGFALSLKKQNNVRNETISVCEPAKTNSRFSRIRMLLVSCAATFGTSWNIPKVILSKIGVKLLIGGILTIHGAIVASIALLFALSIACKAYHYEKKSQQSHKKLEDIKLKPIADEVILKDKLLNDIKKNNKEIKYRISQRQLIIENPNRAEKVQEQIAEIKNEIDKRPLLFEKQESATGILSTMGLFAHDEANEITKPLLDPSFTPK